MSAESAKPYAKKCIDRAERKKDTCHWRVVRKIIPENRSGSAPRQRRTGLLQMYSNQDLGRASGRDQRLLCITTAQMSSTGKFRLLRKPW
jgi:hypothetical protein